MRHSPRFLALVGRAKEQIPECTAEDVINQASELGEFVLIDVREAHEFEAGHAAGAVHMSKGTLERDIEHRYPDPATPLVLYCGGGYRSALSAAALHDMGYQRVWSMAGGWRAWTSARGPTSTPPDTAS